MVDSREFAIKRFRTFWQRITEPVGTVVDREERLKSGLLASVLLIIAMLIMVAMVPRYMLELPTLIGAIRLVIALSVAVFVGGCYEASRRGYYLRAIQAIGLFGTAAILVTAALRGADGVSSLYYLVVLILFISLFFSLRSALFIFVIQLSLTLAFPLLNSKVTLAELLDGPAPFLLLVGTVILLFSYYRERLEAMRRRQLEESAERFRAAIDGSIDAFFLLELVSVEAGNVTNLRIQDMNRGAETLLAMHREQPVGQVVPGSTLLERFDFVLRACQEALSQRRTITGETSSLRRWFFYQIVPLRDGIALTVRDFTERRVADEALRRSEQQYRTLAHNFPNGVVLLFDRDLRYTVADGQVLAELNPSGKLIEGQTVRDCWPANAAEKLEADYRAALSGVACTSEISLGDRMLLVSSIPIRDQTGEVNSGMSTMLDITRRNQVEEALRRSEQQERAQRELAEALRDSSALLTRSLELDDVLRGILDYVGRVVPHDFGSLMLVEGDRARMAYWRGYPPEVSRAMEGFSLPLSAPTLDTLSKGDNPLLIEDTSRSAYWTYAEVTSMIRSYLGAALRSHDRVVGFLNLDSTSPGFFTAVHAGQLQAFANQAAIAIENARLFEETRSHAARLEEGVKQRTAELARAYEQHRELDRLKTKFIADISHELRTPLSNLKVRLYLLDHSPAEQHAEHLDVLKRQTARLTALLEDIFEFAQFELVPREFVVFEAVDINELLEEAVTEKRTLAEGEGLTLMVRLDPALPRIYGQVTGLERMIHNLLSNAIKYTEKGIIEVRSFQSSPPGAIGFSVKDSGIGILPEDLAHVFERFYRGKQVASLNAIPGTGLGLAIVREIVELHNGHIEVQSLPGEGTTFTVTLPAAVSRPSR